MNATDSTFSEARARRALAFAGLPTQVAVHRADSVTNEVHLTHRHVVRVNRKPTGRLQREADLVLRLPQRPWAPEVVAHGHQGGLDYLVVARRPGATLARWWPMLNATQRAEAARQLAATLVELHAVACPAEVPDLEANPQLLDLRGSVPLLPLFNALDQLRSRPGVDPGVVRDAEELLVANGDAVIDRARTGLVHGDLTLENVLWDGTSLTGLVDFEWSRHAPADLDLDVLLRFCAFPGAHLPPERADARAGDYAELPGWLQAAYPALFAHPRLRDRLRLYAVGFNVRLLVAGGPIGPMHTLAPLHPYRQLRQLLDGLSYLDQLWERHLGSRPGVGSVGPPAAGAIVGDRPEAAPLPGPAGSAHGRLGADDSVAGEPGRPPAGGRRGPRLEERRDQAPGGRPVGRDPFDHHQLPGHR